MSQVDHQQLSLTKLVESLLFIRIKKSPNIKNKSKLYLSQLEITILTDANRQLNYGYIYLYVFSFAVSN